MTGDEKAACEAALAANLGRPVALTVEVDPTLIAGLELTSRHAVVRNSLRANLAQIQSTLLTDDAPAT